MTKRQLEILQHSLGVDRYGQGKQHRNHFCAGVGDEPTCRRYQITIDLLASKG